MWERQNAKQERNLRGQPLLTAGYLFLQEHPEPCLVGTCLNMTSDKEHASSQDSPFQFWTALVIQNFIYANVYPAELVLPSGSTKNKSKLSFNFLNI